MAYTLKTTGVIASYTVVSAVVVDESGSGVVDLVGNAITAHANVTYGAASWRGTTRNYFVTKGSGFTGYGVTYDSPPAYDTSLGSGGWCLAIVNGWGPDSNAGQYRTIFVADSASQSWVAYLARIQGTDESLGLGRYGSSFYESADDNYGDAQAAYYIRGKPYGTCGSRRRTAAGTFSAEHTSTDPGFGISDGTLRSIGHKADHWGSTEFFAVVMGTGTLPSQADLDSIADDWFGTLVDSGGGSPFKAAWVPRHQSIIGSR